jgi:Na+-translocating ferredoxin:NAD+ oxidoreductase subunit G
VSNGGGSEAVVTAPRAPEAPPAVKTSSLLTTLGAGGAIAGLLLVIVYVLTLPAIEENKRRDLEVAIKEVLKGAEGYDTLYVVNGTLDAKVPAGADPAKLERVYLGYGGDRQRIGFAFVAREPGFQDVVALIFGYDARKKQLIGMKVLESKETPGLGDKIEKDQGFVGQFRGAQPPLLGVKRGKRSKPGDVDMITGATISSKTVIRIINNTLKRLGPLVDAYPQEGKG